LVQVQGKDNPVRMDQLKQGDYILTQSGKYSEVYTFGHRSDEIMGEFYQFRTATGHTLELSEFHQVMVDSKGGVYAMNVKVDDELLLQPSGETTPVKSIKKIRKKGVYNPLTKDGMIVVNGIAASNTNKAPAMTALGKQLLSIHVVKYWLLAPARFLCDLSSLFCEHNEDGGLYYDVMMDKLIDFTTKEELKAVICRLPLLLGSPRPCLHW